MDWQLADAKGRFSEVVRLALTDGPQRITRRNDAVVVMSEEEYDSITGKKPSLVEFLMDFPSLEGIDLTRDKSEMRDIDL